MLRYQSTIIACDDVCRYGKKVAPSNETVSDIFKMMLPQDGILFDFMCYGLGYWVNWPQSIRKDELEMNVLDIQMPTVDTARYSYLMKMNIRVNIGRPVESRP